MTDAQKPTIAIHVNCGYNLNHADSLVIISACSNMKKMEDASS